MEPDSSKSRITKDSSPNLQSLPKDLYLYDLPQNLIDSLEPLNDSITDPKASTSLVALHNIEHAAPSKASFDQDFINGKIPECSYCGILPGIKSAQDLRAHYKSDYHRFNIKRKLKQLPALSEEDFDSLIGDLDESISGSGSDSDSESDSEITKRIELSTITESNSAEENEAGKSSPAQNTPYVLFTSSLIPDDKLIGIYKQVLGYNPAHDIPPTKALVEQLQPKAHSIILMIGGGHFSAAVISHTRLANSSPTPQNPFAHINILAHKTFHRYTTRRKQGGSQSASDNARGKANSAGSSLRRYNEAALEKEIRELLSSWKSRIDTADAIYVRANGRSNRAILMNYGGPLQSSDKRLRSLPFTTKRATATEIKRAWAELTHPKLLDKPSEPKIKPPTRPLSSADNSTNSKGGHKEIAKKKVLSPAEIHTGEITGIIKKSRSPRLISYFRTNKLPIDMPLEPAVLYSHTPTALFYAAAHGAAHIVSTLLTTLHANPEMVNSQDRTAYEISSNIETKESFQTARHSLGESEWDWNKAKVGPAMTKEQVEERIHKDEQEIKLQRQEQLNKLEEQEKQRKLQNTIARHGQGKKLAGETQIGKESELRGLSDEARIKLERERRARAAEARFR